jgi:hypothetical protein
VNLIVEMERFSCIAVSCQVTTVMFFLLGERHIAQSLGVRTKKHLSAGFSLSRINEGGDSESNVQRVN